MEKTRHRQNWPVSPYPRVQESKLSMIHNKGPQFSSSITSPMQKTGIFKYMNYYFITCEIFNITKSRYFKVTYTQNGGPFSFSFCSEIIYYLLKNTGNGDFYCITRLGIHYDMCKIFLSITHEITNSQVTNGEVTV